VGAREPAKLDERTSKTGLADQPDAELVALARSGEMAAFEELVRRYRNPVFAHAYHFVRQREEAWDVSQEVFIKAYRALPRFRGESNFKTWLMRITGNQCKDSLKRRKPKAVPLREGLHQNEIPADESRPDQTAYAREIGEAIVQLLEAMPFKHRQAFILREFEGLSYQEMARVMGCRLGTVMSRLHHARKRLRKRLIEIGIMGSTGRAQQEMATKD